MALPISSSSSSSARRLMFLDHASSSSSHNRFLMIPPIICIFFVFFVLLVFLRLLLPRTIAFLRRRRHRRPLPTASDALLLLPEFRYRELKSCTAGFSDARKLGQGASGVVYRGFLRRTRQEIAVKRLLRGSLAEMELQNEIRIMNHVNIAAGASPPSPPLLNPPTVGLLGYCRHGDERLLVYEYMPNRSLQEALFDPNRPSWPMSWETRFKVVMDTARALAFLHSLHPCAIIHGDIKPSNILLDANFCARIADFGLARLFTAAPPEFGAPPPEPAAASDTTTYSVANLGRRRRNSRSHSHKPKDKHKLQRMYMWPKIDASVADQKKKRKQPPPAAAWSAAITPAPIGSPCASSFFSGSPEYSDAASSVLSKQTTSEEAAALYDRNDAVDGRRSDGEMAAGCAEEKVAVVMSLYNNGATTTSEDEDKQRRQEAWEIRAGDEARDSSAKAGWWWKQAGSYGGDTQASHTAKEYVMEWIRKQEVHREPSPSSDSPTTSSSSCCAAIQPADSPTASSIPAVADPRPAIHGSAAEAHRESISESARVEEHPDEASCSGGGAALSKKRSGGGGSSRRGRSWRSASSASLEWWMQHSDEEEGRGGGGGAAEELVDDRGGGGSGSKRGREGTVGKDWRKNAVGRRRSMSGGGGPDRMSGARGTICYAAPEMGGGGGEAPAAAAAAAEEGRVDEKSDVYSYGMLMLVVVSGRRPLQVSETAAISDVGRASLLSWARRLARSGGGDELELVDPALGGVFDERQASLCIQVALQCLQRRPAMRPSMADVVAMLSGQTPFLAAPPHRRRTCGPLRDGRFHTRHSTCAKIPHI